MTITMKNTKAQMHDEIVRLNNIINELETTIRRDKPIVKAVKQHGSVHEHLSTKPMPQWQKDRAVAMAAARKMAMEHRVAVKV